MYESIPLTHNIFICRASGSATSTQLGTENKELKAKLGPSNSGEER